MYDVFCYGAISLDISGQLEAPYEEGRQSVATDYRISPGGDATLVAIMLSGMGLKVALGGGPTGDDPMGAYVRDSLRDLGVHILAPVFGKTSIASILLRDGVRRSIVTFHDETEENEIPVQEEAIKASKYVYVDGCYARNSAIAGSAARAANIPSLLNFDRLSITNVSLFNTVIANEISAGIFSEDPVEAVKQIYELNDSLAIVTLGERGCIYCDGSIGRRPAFDIKAVDTTGAGAAFATGFIYAQMAGKSLKECLHFASACGAYKAIARGSYRRFGESEISRFIKSHA